MDAATAAYGASGDWLSKLDDRVLLEVIETSCIYLRTRSMKEAQQRAVIELQYTDQATFALAAREAKQDPRIKLLGFSLPIPTIVDGLTKLYESCLLANVDTVLIHHGGSTIVRFTNVACSQQVSDDSCSLFLAITELRVRAASASMHMKSAAVDGIVPLLVFGLVALAIVVTGRGSRS